MEKIWALEFSLHKPDWYPYELDSKRLIPLSVTRTQQSGHRKWTISFYWQVLNQLLSWFWLYQLLELWEISIQCLFYLDWVWCSLTAPWKLQDRTLVLYNGHTSVKIPRSAAVALELCEKYNDWGVLRWVLWKAKMFMNRTF